MDEDIVIHPTPVKIVNGMSDYTELWARSFPPQPLDKPPFDLGITFVKGDPYYVFERWQLRRFEDGMTIQNVGNGLWACAKDGEVVMTSDFDAGNCKWYYHGSKGSSFRTIRKANEDLVWTMKHPKRQFSIVLMPSDLSDIQKFCFDIPDGD
ncbi:hypothetical protein Agabi119p4_5591 [Agaricus bisporus var. burnettii]|uniref:Uncharacterized protein n=1 Tax=Agaricus bisporus var. burnettii TaxID=192524 RepID=A0A8H7F207_AGABI|nr:hypothetical protein Agabi119p4_5591 [Agaricus bisporus var. burnettii]